ncbi:MAG: DUF1297 domain-containing protein, partial [Candidatus Aenigmarchaeota archaeon]|nr:DUF1297 domain-containing protein [Candidatus Aenigmarchaeota archaeon]
MNKEVIEDVLGSYDKNSIRIGVLGSHSALDICAGAKKQGFKTLVVCEKGREKTYDKYYRVKTSSWGETGVVDETIVLEKFKDIVKPKILKLLEEKNVIFIPHRSFCVYVGYEAVENSFSIPIFGNRSLLKIEERNVEKNQYYLLRKAGIKIPLIFKDYSEIDRTVIVKVKEKDRPYERAFFIVSSPEEFEKKVEELLKKGVIPEDFEKDMVIEEFVVGAQFNFNFFYSPLTEELELLGIDTRRQTNLDGILKLPHPWQKEVVERVKIKYIEVGHIASTIRESLLERVFEMGERFVEAAKKEFPPGVIGPFALQSLVVPGPPREDIVVFDVSVRSPGSPGIMYTPYSYY